MRPALREPLPMATVSGDETVGLALDASGLPPGSQVADASFAKVPLPDVSLTGTAPSPRPLDWVGMQGIDLPITLAEHGYRRELHARADAQVDLPWPDVKGIHMSRLYGLVEGLAQGHPLSPAVLRQLLQDMLDSHRDCGSRRARLRLLFELLVRRQALVTPDLQGWKSYPVVLQSELVDGRFVLRVRVTVGYSSTCPCSAALSRQQIELAFLESFGHQPNVHPDQVAAWLRDNATFATPHSQRSEASVEVHVGSNAPTIGILALIERIEQAVGTPLQTAVKRRDEQAFALRNGQNLMFVEDAARRIQATLNGYLHPIVKVRHLESLHPHDAVAWASDAESEFPANKRLEPRNRYSPEALA